MSSFKPMTPDKESITITDHRKIAGNKRSTDGEAKKNIDSLTFFASIMADTVIEEIRRKKLLETSPAGFHFDKTGYSCMICGRGASGETSWYDEFGLKCMTCQKAIDKKIIPGSVATKKESWYSKSELEIYFNIKRMLLNKYTKQGLLEDRVILNAENKEHLQLFLIKDNRNVLPPKNLLRSRTIKVMKDGEEYYTSEHWYEFIDEKLAKKLFKYKIVECFKETFAQPINGGRFYHKGLNPLFTYKY